MRQRGLGAIVGIAAALALPSVASAASGATIYPPDINSRSFVTSDAGWEKASGSSGLCLDPLTCPDLSTGFVTSGGTLGASDGYIATRVNGLTGVGSESRAVLRSPAFTYDGVDGAQPSDVVLSLSHFSQLQALLTVAGTSADYTVELVDASAGGKAIRVIDSAPLGVDQSWTSPGPVAVSPSALKVGDEYRIRIITRLAYGAQVLEGGQVGYDDVELVAIDDTGGGSSTNPGGGNTHPGGGSAVFDGRNLFIKLKCLGVSAHGKCHVRATALASKHGKRYTFPIQRKVKAKHGKVIRARVRFQFRSKLEHARTVTLKSVVTAGDKHRRKFTKLKLIKRGN